MQKTGKSDETAHGYILILKLILQTLADFASISILFADTCMRWHECDIM